MKYKIYFTLYSRKVITEIEANTPVHAEKLLRERIRIDKIVELPEPDETLENLKNIFGMT